MRAERPDEVLRSLLWGRSTSVVSRDLMGALFWRPRLLLESERHQCQRRAGEDACGPRRARPL